MGAAGANHLADPGQGKRRQRHVVAAEIAALRVARPGRHLDRERFTEPFPRQHDEALLRDGGEHGAEHMIAAGRVLELCSRFCLERPGQRVSHPVRAVDERTVVWPRRALEPRPHRQEVLDRERGDPVVRSRRNERGRKVAERRLHPREVPLVDRDAGEERDNGLRHRLDVHWPVWRRSAESAREHGLAVVDDDHRVKLVEPCRTVRRVREAIRRSRTERKGGDRG